MGFLKNCFWFLALLLNYSLLPAQESISNDNIIAGIQKGNSSFVENMGQIVSMEDHTPVSSILFRSSGKSSDIYLQTNGISYVFYKYDSPEIDENDIFASSKTSFTGKWERIDMVFVNSNPKPKIEKSEQIDYFENYYLAHCPSGIKNVKSYRKITYKNLYKNIDWVVRYNEKGQLKYDFIVHPGGNPNDIQIKYNWSDAPLLNQDGSIQINGPLGNIIEATPFVTQENQEIQSSWKIKPDGTLYFEINNFDKNKELIIDPILFWATYYGDTGEDKAYCIESDGTSVFTSGIVSSVNFPTLNPGGGAYFQGSFSGVGDAFIIKFNTLGVRQWATYVGGSGDDIVRSISLNSNYIYITGQTVSDDFPTLDPLNGAYYQASNAASGASDAFILMFDKSGIRQWATYFGGNFWDAGYSISANDNFLYIAMNTGSSNMPIYNPGGGAFIQNTMLGTNDNYILKLTAQGATIWGTYFGGSGIEQAFPAIKELNNNIYFTGSSTSTDFPTIDPGAPSYFVPTNAGGIDITISKFNLNGVLSWSTYQGGSLDDYIRCISGNNNQFWIGGSTTSNNIPTQDMGSGAYFQGISGGNFDGFISSFNYNNQYIWGTYYGGTNSDNITNLHTDNNSIWVAGRSASTNFPLLNPGMGSFFQGVKSSGYDAIFLKFKQTGVRQWATYYGGNGNEDASCIFSDNSYVWASGLSNSTTLFTLDPGNGAFYTASNSGTNDAFILKFDVCIKPNVTISSTSPVICLLDTSILVASGAQTYQWQMPIIFNDSLIITPPTTSDFIVTGTDDMNCLNNDTFTVQVNPLPQLIITQPDSICFGDSITIHVTSDLPSYYLWAPGLTTDSTLTVYPDTVNHTFHYYVLVTDSVNGCRNVDSTSIYVNALPQLTITQPDSICLGDTITLLVSSDLPSFYLWTPGAGTDSTYAVSPDSINFATTYNVIVTDTLNGCKNYDTTTVFVNPVPILSITPSDSICFGDSIPLIIYSDLPSYYLWTPGNESDSIIIVSPDSINYATIYNVLVTDTLNGCKSQLSTSVYVNALPQLIISQTDSICYRDTITLSVHSDLPSYYLWTPGNGTDSLFAVSPDTVHQTFIYNVLVTDTVNGCKNNASTSVFVNALPQLTITQADSICLGDTITLLVSSDLPSTYLWTPGNGTDSLFSVYPNSPNQNYLYNVVVTDTINGCKNNATTSVFVNALPLLFITPPDSICYGDNITLQVFSDLPSDFLWSPGNGSDSTLSTFTVQPNIPYQHFIYNVIATDTLNGCKNNASTDIYVNGKPDLSILGSHPICPYDSIILNAFSNDTIFITHLWEPSSDTSSTITFYPSLPDSIYQISVIGTSVYNCKDTASTFIIVYPSINVNIAPTDTSICLLDSITLHGNVNLIGNTGYSFEWFGPNISATTTDITFSPDSTGTYTLVGTTTEQCKDTTSVDITVFSLPKVKVSGFQEMCFGDSVIITASTDPPDSTTTFSWAPYSGQDTTTVILYPSITTTYMVTGTDTNTCHSSVLFDVIVYPLPVASISGINQICYGDQTTLTASNSTVAGITHYLWNTNDTTNIITVSPPNTCVYSVIAFQNICSDTITYPVTIDPKPILTLTPDTTLIIGMSLQLNVSGANEYIWSPLEDITCITCPNPVVDPLNTIEYCVIGTNNYGCSDTACIVVTIDKECGEVFVPSAFSPNDDLNNDVLYVYGKCIKSMEFRIFNRWGEKVFESTNPEKGWDGKFRGKESDTDVFVYYLKAEYYIGTKVETKGNITLMR